MKKILDENILVGRPTHSKLFRTDGCVESLCLAVLSQPPKAVLHPPSSFSCGPAAGLATTGTCEAKNTRRVGIFQVTI